MEQAVSFFQTALIILSTSDIRLIQMIDNIVGVPGNTFKGIDFGVVGS